ncbi:MULTISPECIES: DUF2946 family protein [unclassified Sphingobium]|uniref:DUF2946 family protein n=1 Tax=unclassified Sphingobium TaxID=2611147 RepID=UPI000D158040|nr:MULTISPECIES: DUF2946 family protein [unclassified Sphingobium]PSO10583.1 hypothetical protein C7E20_16400 [Sphingobium sp. AEW4]TWD01181.1 DUF2946 family protein [Sphingobium sp. AEW010]TWD19949.1 DUF2946 family protein [Sphingobium sp. AEW013]TWD22565.1 DUF2946 family protein [Sphingobium sp. AEW001]
MNRWIRQPGRCRGLFALLMLCALAIRIAIPTGFMPTQGADGIVISLCTGQGAVKAVLPLDKGGQPSDHHQSQGGECNFAAGLGGGLLTPVLSLLPLLPVPVASQVTDRAIADLTVHRLAAPPPPSQGPPARA